LGIPVNPSGRRKLGGEADVSIPAAGRIARAETDERGERGVIQSAIGRHLQLKEMVLRRIEIDRHDGLRIA
jgi:hypothetical protein